MPTKQEKTDIASIEILRIMFDADRRYLRRTLQSRVLVTSPDRVRRGLESMGGFNAFAPGLVYRALEDLVFPHLEFNEETAGIYLGREGSPVIYLPTVYTELGTDHDAFVSACNEAGRRAHADEITTEYQTHVWDEGDEPEMPDRPRSVRLWWD